MPGTASSGPQCISKWLEMRDSSPGGAGQGQSTAGLWLTPGSRAAAAGSARAGGPWGRDTTGHVQLPELTGTKTQGRRSFPRPTQAAARAASLCALCACVSGVAVPGCQPRQQGGEELFCGCGSRTAVVLPPPQPHLLRSLSTPAASTGSSTPHSLPPTACAPSWPGLDGSASGALGSPHPAFSALKLQLTGSYGACLLSFHRFSFRELRHGHLMPSPLLRQVQSLHSWGGCWDPRAASWSCFSEISPWKFKYRLLRSTCTV